MKINPGIRTFGKEIQRSESSSTQQLQNKSFSDMMQNQDERASQEQLQRILQQISMQGDRLAKSMTVRELRQYKLLVKQFLEETARRGVQLRDTRGWDRRGRAKRYKLLEEVDQQLLMMADDMLESEQGRIDLLHKIGEIRGMLINLTF
ncbi:MULTISPECIES: YaaR family protein [Paenibacillus]|uniref:YaaR family protein n=1 Tax=Paenibacillus radicis (ex Xue et al. 2023) TaxID=2972489 RepID=A0ABT1YSD3_9BACL|nr:YaaR family protein [Paenibacillus radicis (ex Xue et al. 2023)]MCR8636085.1 YaaR family protein [Paenibacillus radicis (ex Xue et al. 2023)]